MSKNYIKSNDNLLNICIIEGVEDEQTVLRIPFDKYNCLILVTRFASIHNVYIIHEAFKKEPLNNLYLQQPVKHGIPKALQLELYAIQYYLWYKHNKDFSITFEDIE